MTTLQKPSDSSGSSSSELATESLVNQVTVEQTLSDRVTEGLDLPRSKRTCSKYSEVYSMVRKLACDGLIVATRVGKVATPVLGKLLSLLKSCSSSIHNFIENALFLAFTTVNFNFGSSLRESFGAPDSSEITDSEQSQNVDYDSENDSMPDLVESGEEDTNETTFVDRKLIVKETGLDMLRFRTEVETGNDIDIVSTEHIVSGDNIEAWQFIGQLANPAVTMYNAHLMLKHTHVAFKMNQMKWFANSAEGALLFRTCNALQHDEMPLDCVDVDQWLKEEFFILTGLKYEHKDKLFKGEPVNTGEPERVGYCWTILFEGVDKTSFRFHPIVSGYMLKHFVEIGKKVTDVLISAEKINNGRMWHVELGGSMTPLHFITEILQDDELVGAVDLDFNAEDDHAQLNDAAMANDERIWHDASFVNDILNHAAQMKYWLGSALSIVWDWISMTWSWFIFVRLLLVLALIVRMSCMMGWHLINAIMSTLQWVIGHQVYRKLLVWLIINMLNIVQLSLRFVTHTTFKDVIGFSALLILLVLMLAPWLIMILVQLMALSSVAMMTTGLYLGTFSRMRSALINASGVLLDLIARVVGLAPFRFVIHAIVTMWVVTDRPQRGSILLVTHDSNGNRVDVTDTFDAPTNVIDCAIVLKDLIVYRTGNMFIAIMVIAVIASIVIRLFWSILRPIVRVGAMVTRIVTFGIASGVLVFFMPNVSFDVIEYATLLIRLHLKAIWHNTFEVLKSLQEALNERVEVLKSYKFSYTPAEIMGFKTHVALPELQLAMFRTRVLSVARSNVVRFVTAVENVNIPGLLKNEYTKPSLQTIQESMELLKEIGWPVNVDVYEKHKQGHSGFADLEDWVAAESTFVQPLRNIKTVINEELRYFKGMEFPVYKHTGTYTSPEVEVAATARYFKNNDSPAAVDVVNDTWDMVYPHFEHSRLANTGRVVSKLVKKYSAGFGFMDPTRPKTMSRKVLMCLIGGEQALVALFDKTLPYVGKLIPIAHVFTKFETIKESKWAKGVVRTIIGVPLVHYANTSKFSYMQNARHPFSKSPIKVGMPLTGAWFADLWEEHATRAHHFNGDLKSADSSYSRRIFDIIKAVRKKGFKAHRDFDKICSFIDIAYDQLMVMPLAFKSTGVIAFKGDGGATGQGNTSIDNSVALVVLYMMAWKNITGKSAKEFKLYNTLSNQGDDHILSYDDNDLNWSPKTWMPEFAKLGVTVTDESGSDRLEDVDFLAKRIVTDDQNERIKMHKLGLKCPRYLTAHDKGRLLGKINAEQPLRDNQARARRLLSYLYLTAHHEDVYLITVRCIRELQRKSRGSLTVKVPPYRAIMKAWYSKKDNMIQKSMASAMGEDDENSMLQALDEFGDIGDIVHVTKPKGLDTLLICLSMIPQMFSPRFMTSPALRHIQKLEGHRLAWVGELLARRNDSASTVGGLSATMMKSNYDFLNGVDMAPYRCGRSDFSLLLSHWVFILLQFMFGGQGVSGFNKTLKNLDHWLANCYFVMFAQCTNTIEAIGFGYIDTMLCLIADLVPDFAIGLELPRVLQIIPSEVVTRIVTRIWRNLQPSAALDFEVIELMVNKMDFIGSKTIVIAPTGVGKSTRMISKLATLCPSRHIFVIEPRHILVTGLADYMSTIDHSVSYGASTTGRSPSSQDMVVYCTYQSFVLNNFGKDDDIVVIDEAHIKDPIYKFAVQDLLSRKCTCLLVTATPDPMWSIQYASLKSIELNVAKLWRTVVHQVETHNKTTYADSVITASRSFGPSDKVLIFMPTINNCKQLARELPGNTCVISSKHKFIDENAQFYVSTRVSDAGLTLPDVNFVFTMDIDFNVSSDVTNGEWYNPRSIREYYRLDELTINQRIGRTGRTCDGTVYIFHVTGQYEQRRSTAKDLLDELDQLLDMSHIVDKLPNDSLELWNIYTSAAEMLGGDITAQSLFPSPSHQRNPSPQMKQNIEWCVTKGMAAKNAVLTCFDPLRTGDMFSKEICESVRRGDPIPIPLEEPGKREALVFWGDMPINSLNNTEWQPDGNRDVYNWTNGVPMYSSVSAYFDFKWVRRTKATRPANQQDIDKRNLYMHKIVSYRKYLATGSDLHDAEMTNAVVTFKDKAERLEAFLTLKGINLQDSVN